MAHEITLGDTFHGPLDLLLYLVKRDEVDIHNIPISHVTREYLKEIERMRDPDIDLASEFLTMASMLMEIKSRMLLPPAEEEEGEDGEEVFDPRQGLVKALLEYKRFKEVAALLAEMAESHERRFPRQAPPPDLKVEVETQIEELGVLDLFAAFQKMARKLLSAEANVIEYDEVPTEERIQTIETAIATAADKRVAFSSLLSDNPTPGEMVGYFIAIMELIRMRRVRAQQSVDFGEIYIRARDAGEALAAACPRRRPLALARIFAPARIVPIPPAPARGYRGLLPPATFAVAGQAPAGMPLLGRVPRRQLWVLETTLATAPETSLDVPCEPLPREPAALAAEGTGAEVTRASQAALPGAGPDEGITARDEADPKAGAGLGTTQLGATTLGDTDPAPVQDSAAMVEPAPTPPAPTTPAVAGQASPAAALNGAATPYPKPTMPGAGPVKDGHGINISLADPVEVVAVPLGATMLGQTVLGKASPPASEPSSKPASEPGSEPAAPSTPLGHEAPSTTVEAEPEALVEVAVRRRGVPPALFGRPKAQPSSAPRAGRAASSARPSPRTGLGLALGKLGAAPATSAKKTSRGPSFRLA